MTRLYPAALRGLATDLAMAWREFRYARHNRRHPVVPPSHLIHGRQQ